MVGRQRGEVFFCLHFFHCSKGKKTTTNFGIEKLAVSIFQVSSSFCSTLKRMRPSAALLRGSRRLLLSSSLRGNWRWNGGSGSEESPRGTRRHSKFSTTSASSSAAAASSASSTPPPRLSPGLYIVATPIGNLEDLSPRAARVLATADAVLCEDTRRSGPLVAAAVAASTAAREASSPSSSSSAPSRLISLHAHNEASRTASVLERLARGEAVALVSDAGTPAVSDPGGGVAAAAAAAGFDVLPVPGPCAAAAAVSACGLDAGDWLFVGFLPAKAKARLKRLREIAAATGAGGAGAGASLNKSGQGPLTPSSSAVSAAVVAYVPARTLAATLADASLAFGPHRRVAVARELTKLHEEWWRGELAEGAAVFAARTESGKKGAAAAAAAAAAASAEDEDDDDEEDEEGEVAGGEGGSNNKLLKGEVTIVIERAKNTPSSSASSSLSLEGESKKEEEEKYSASAAPLLLTLDADAALGALLAEGVPPSAAARALAAAAQVPRGPLYNRAQRLSSSEKDSAAGDKDSSKTKKGNKNKSVK